MNLIATRIIPNYADQALGHAAARSPLRLATAINLVLHLAQGNIAQRAPVGWSGALRGGYHTEMSGVGGTHPRGILSNATLYHDAVETGRRPGKRPPTAALIPWVGSKLGIPPGPEREQVAFLVARAIGRRGTKGAHMVRDGWAATRIQSSAVLYKMGWQIVQDIR
jgi:hypothetical protein